jgi:hypothetical protein
MEALNALLPLKTRIATLSLAQWIVLLVNGLTLNTALYHVVAVNRLALVLS